MDLSSSIVDFLPPQVSTKRGEIVLGQREYARLSALIYKRSGISLKENRISMVQSRLGRRLGRLNLDSYNQYIRYLQEEKSGEEFTNFVNALTTNKTEFFREAGHFKFMEEEYLSSFVKSHEGGEPLYVWSGASSTGEEVYSLAISLEEFGLRQREFSYRVLGTDIDTEILKRAGAAVYEKKHIKGLPFPYIQRYFLKGKRGNQGSYRVSETLTRNTKFRYHNLVDYESRIPIRFDIIFLRNVMIYFDHQTIERVVKKMTDHLLPGGLLFIGHSETLHNINHELKPVGSAVYLKPAR